MLHKILRNKDEGSGGSPAPIDFDKLTEGDDGSGPSFDELEKERQAAGGQQQQVNKDGQQQQQKPDEGGQQQQQPPDNSGQQQQQQPEDPFKDLDPKLFYQFAKQRWGEFLPKDYQDPTDINKENIDRILAEMAYNTADWEGILNPQVMELQRTINALDGDVEKAIQEWSNQRSWKVMDDEALVKWHYKENLKIQDDKMDKAVEGVNYVKEAAAIRRDLEAVENDWIAQIEQQNLEKSTQQRQLEEQERNAEIEATVANFNKKSDVWGIPLEAKHKDGFSNIIKKYVTPGEDGVAPIAKLLANSDFLANMIFMAEYKDSAIKELVFNAKAEVKEGIKQKLDPEPKFTQASVHVDKTKINLDALTEPDDGTY